MKVKYDQWKCIKDEKYYREIEFRRYDAEFSSVKSTSLGFILWEFLNVRINFRDWSKQPMGMEVQYMTKIPHKNNVILLQWRQRRKKIMPKNLIHLGGLFFNQSKLMAWVLIPNWMWWHHCSVGWDIMDRIYFRIIIVLLGNRWRREILGNQ